MEENIGTNSNKGSKLKEVSWADKTAKEYKQLKGLKKDYNLKKRQEKRLLLL